MIGGPVNDNKDKAAKANPITYVSKDDAPFLIVHGTKDRILPFEATAKRLEGLIADVKVVPVENGPHNIGWTFPDECNSVLLSFLG